MKKRRFELLAFLSGSSLALLGLGGQTLATGLTPPVIDLYTQVHLTPGDDFTRYRHTSNIPDFQVHQGHNIFHLEAQISQGLPANQRDAKSPALERLQTFQQDLVHAWAHSMTLRQLDLTHLPAIVFNHGEFIWYGSRLDQAISAYYAQTRGRQDG